MEDLMGKRTMTGKSPNGAPGPSLFSSRRPNLDYSSPLPSTPASQTTRATCVPPSGSLTTLSPCPLTLPRQSSALSVRARACTSPPSCLRLQLQPAGRACLLLQRPSPQHAACCAPVSKKDRNKDCDVSATFIQDILKDKN